MVRNTTGWSGVLFFIGFGFLVGMLSVASCGGGGGGGEANATSHSSPSHRIHTSISNSYFTGTHGANLTLQEIDTKTFTPTAANDVILYVALSGTYSATNTNGGSFRVQVEDATGNVLAIVNKPITLTGPSVGYRIQTSIAPPLEVTNFAFPSASYTLRLFVSTGASWVGDIEDSSWTIMTVENVTQSLGSSNFN